MSHAELKLAASTLLGLKKGGPKSAFSSSKSSVSSALVFSEEQEHALHLKGDRIVITALAGCGKSRVLSEIARRNPLKQWHYLAFNKSMALEAQSLMPDKVSCKTIHALAYQEFGKNYQSKIALQWASGQIFESLKELSHDHPNDVLLIIAVLERYFASSDHHLKSHHIPHLLWFDFKKDHQTSFIDDQALILAAFKVWQRMLDYADDLPMMLDGLVKLMQLSSYQPFSNKAALLVDEAQDLTPCVRAWLETLPVQIVRAGDPYQSIYSWRMHGLQSAWVNEKDQQAWLCGSWRFGPEVAQLVAPVLKSLGSPHELIGLGTSTVIDSHWDQEEFEYLFRTRSALVARAVHQVQEGKGLNLESSPWLKDFLQNSKIDALQSLEEDSEKWTNSVRSNREALIEASHMSSSVRLLTAHASKGATFDRVRLGPDFAWPNPLREQADPIEEARLLYVALTRAKFHLSLPEDLLEALRKNSLPSWQTSSVPSQVLNDDGF